MLSKLNDLVELMKNENLDQIVIDTFSDYYEQILSGATGKMSKSEIKQPEEKFLKNYEELNAKGSENLSKLVVIKLNGGLGTSMGLTKAKSLLPIKNGLTFLDVIAKQILYLREVSGQKIPLLLMNSFNTQKDTLEFLSKYENLKLDFLPLDFLQNKFPKIKISDFSPLGNSDSKKNWNPPGHGDIYMSLAITKILDRLLDNGIEYAFMSNSDNLGAIVDEKILNYFAKENFPFMMEVCTRTEMDKKGGHLAQTLDNRLVLRETAQCPNDEVEEFQDVHFYKYFNTNNLWINLKALKKKLVQENNLLILPMILNQKEVDNEKIYQIETAMGAAISVFEGSHALIVPRSRFVPVKKTNELLAIWSDAFTLNDNFSIGLDKELSTPPIVDLDPKFYKTINQLQMRFLDNIPSLKKCKKVKIEGNIFFGKNVVLEDDVKISGTNENRIENQIIKGNYKIN